MQRFPPVKMISVEAFKENFDAVIKDVKYEPVVLQKHSQVLAVLLSASLYEAVIERLDDQYLALIIHSRRNEIGKPIELDQL
ncbi:MULTISPECIES: type II toxin-antitoxin system Phd/YefM family antitoxin [Pseudomonas]|uniref:type II toxin-antitoxin system Phd/YefM family antitoxin n=1 Tax=Pseudomonas TaxID=286 RepID=UPI00087612DB|nr:MULTISPECIES: type II toxin-antitoxin system Phd/YefM family antitoxin [Pseudomonas]QIA00900.1 type II toxin-antitoxin system Phd/YefM family antitoxin [Pseudomonas fluorescens]TFA84438.1 antitoxin StbD [Pseudomonas sp. LAIL14HWK12:I2]SCZ34226.1 antitoxin StbD [Pseudomonas sp. NFIX46]SDB30093.1 antitoxin StbD [Pseudomonas putida]SFQ86361.1 antitoxin StbD [Pseudomonas sp. NFIX49]